MKLLIFAVCALILGLGVFFGFIRRSNRALVRLITLIACVIGAFFLAKALAASIGEQLLDYVRSAVVNDPDFAAYIEENPTLVDSLAAVCRMLVGPILFVILYVALKLVTLFVYWIVCTLFHIKGPELFGLGRVLGAVVGLLCGLIGAVVFVTPICGYATVMENVMVRLELQSSENSAAQTINGIADCKNATLAAPLYDLMGNRFFEGLTATTVGEESVSLEGEITSIVGLLEHVKALGGKSVESYGDAEAAAVAGIASSIDDSFLLSNVGSGALAGFSEAWLQNDAFLGIAKPQMDGEIDSIFTAFLQVFSTSNASNIGQDLGTFSDMFALLVKHDMFALLTSKNENAFADKLAQPGVIADFYALLEANPRMTPVKVALGDAGMRLLLGQLGVPETLRDTHGALMNDMAGVLQSAVDEQGNVDVDAVESGLAQTLQDHAVAVPEGAVQMVSDALVEEFTAEELTSLSTDQVIDRLIDRFSGAQLTDNNANAGQEPAVQE